MVHVVCHLVSAGAGQEDTDSSEDEDDSCCSDDEVLPVYVWRPGQYNEAMAEWEKHTKVSMFNICITFSSLLCFIF